MTYTVTVTDSQSATDTETVTITITGTNDAPEITDGPDTADLAETDAGLTASGTLTVSDVDTTDTVAASRTLVVSGTSDRSDPAAPSDAALLGMFTLNPTAILDNTENSDTLNWDFNSGAEAFDYLATGETLILTYTVTVTDSQSATDTETVTITITGTNDAPVNTIPGDQSVGESPATLAIGGISVNDVDGNLSSTQLSVNNGTVSVLLAGAASISAGANGTSDLTISGTQADINATLATLSYEGNVGFSGVDTLTVTSTDSDAGSDVDTIDIVVNDAPVNTVPAAQSVAEDTPLAIGGISVTDPNGNLASTQLSVNHGTLTVVLAGAATISAGANGSSDLTIAGTEADINATLASLSYQGNLNFHGSDELTVTSMDNVGVLPGSDIDTVGITVTPVNDIPELTVFASTVDTTLQNTQVEVSFSDLTAQGDEADVDGTVDGFVVQSVTSGTLLLGATAGTATPFIAGVNDTITAGTNAYWTPGVGDSGAALNAFTVVALDNDGAESAAPVQVTVQVTVPPVVIDLDGDGLEFLGLSDSTIHFDIDGDGQAEQTAWASGDDGVLAYDFNKDGKITERSEVVFTDHAEGASTDLEALRLAFDTDGDGKLTSGDEEWSLFGVWQDANEDGFSDEGEFLSLDAMGITSIDLQSDGISSLPTDGVYLHGQSRVDFADGSSGIAGDVSFSYAELPDAGEIFEEEDGALAQLLVEMDEMEAASADGGDTMSAGGGGSAPVSSGAISDESAETVLAAGDESSGGEVAPVVAIEPADVAPVAVDATQPTDAPPALVA